MAKRDSLKSYWLSAYTGSNPVIRSKMKYLIILNRFDINLDILSKKLNSSIKKEERDRITVNDINVNDSIKLDEVKEIIPLIFDYKPFHGFNELCQDALYAFKQLGKNKFKVETRFLTKQKFSGKQVYKRINTYLKKEGFSYDEDGETVYIEFNKNLYRVGLGIIKKETKFEVNMENIAVILEKPESVIEISDFLRLAYVFKLKLFFIESKGFDKMLKKDKEETKGIDYNKFKFDVVKELPRGYIYVGFSKNASKNEKDLFYFLKNNKKIALVFGNEKYGMSQELRDRMDEMIRLTPEMKKPLRASHELSYVLGIYASM